MMTKSNVRRKGLIWFTSYYLLPVEGQAGTWHQELKQTPWRNTASCLAPPGLLRLLSYALQDQLLRGCTTHNILGPPTSIISKKNAPQAYHRLIWWEHLHNLYSLFPMIPPCIRLNKTNQYNAKGPAYEFKNLCMVLFFFIM